ncbi:MAG: hypothetical protein FJW40_26375 [Acidobacteria bacterium]|nr:hypothetical protein [Acidobacteriota bacterium]
MATLLQSNTSRANGALSNGPVTPQGKARSAQNSLQHGLYAKGKVLPWESQEEFDQLRQNLHIYYPLSQIYSYLVDQLASELWHIQRAERFEEALLISNHAEARANLISHGNKNPTEDQILANTYIRLNTCSSYVTALRERSRAHRHARLLRAELEKLLRQLLAEHGPDKPLVAPAPIATEATRADTYVYPDHGFASFPRFVSTPRNSAPEPATEPAPQPAQGVPAGPKAGPKTVPTI